MSKIILFDKQAQDKLLKGVKILSDAVSATLGPLGNNVALDKKWGAPNIIHDGVTVAKEVSLKDPFENMGAQLVKEASLKTNDNSGDGTTTSTILSHFLIREGFKKINAGTNSMKLRMGIRLATKALIEELKNRSTKIDTLKEMTQIAKISSQDPEIGDLIAKAIKKVGKDGVVTVEAGKGIEVSVDYKEGMEFDNGYASPYFVTNTDKMIAEVDYPLLLITDKKLSSLNDILPFMEAVVKSGKSIVLIADAIEGEVLQAMVMNKLKGVLRVIAVRAPAFGDRRKEILEDIAVLTDGTVIGDATGKGLDTLTLEDCGMADKVWADKQNTRIIGGKGLKENIDARIKSIKAQIAKTTSDYDKEKLQERLATLTTGVAVINIGAQTELELNEKKERAIDAVAATKAALEEGVLPGGATTLIHIAYVLDKITNEDKEIQAGIDIVKEAVWQPFKILMANSGLAYDLTAKPLPGFGFGIDVMDGQYKEMLPVGIIDPTKVVRSALDNAASVAASILTTKVLITDEPEEVKQPINPNAY